jgi:hypothetical protein
VGNKLVWIVSAVAAGVACAVAALPATPIDRALPLAGVVVVLLAWIAERPAMAMAAPALIVCELVFVDEHLRLLMLGAVVAIAFAFAAVLATRGHALIAALAIVMLRWIPLHDVVWWRELLVLSVAVIARGPASIFVAVAVALFTPAWPAKTLLIPVLVAVVGVLWGDRRPRLSFRADRRGRLSPHWTAALALAIVLTFYPWSGLIPRGWRAFLHPPRVQKRIALRYPLAPGQSATFDFPPDAESLIVSAANLPRARRGTPLGRIDPMGIVVRIGDASDWGFMRREHVYASRNGYPRDPAGQVRDYGWSAWIDGAGRILLPRRAGTIRVTADPRLPKGATLQVESIELVEPR